MNRASVRLSPGETALPFAVWRIWDVPAALAWGFLLAIAATSPWLRAALKSDVDAAVVASVVVVAVAGAVAGAVAAAAAVVGAGSALVSGGLVAGLLHCGLAPTLPFALVGVPLLLLGLRLAVWAEQR